MKAWRPMLAEVSRTTAVVAVVATTAVACNSHGGVDAGHLSYEQYDSEYKREAAKLTLPAGTSWPAHAQAYAAPPGHSLTYEPGVGVGNADQFWFCAWSRAWLKAPDKSLPEAQNALKALSGVRNTALYGKSSGASDRQLYDDELAKAALGDAGPLQREVQLNCPKPAS